MVELADKQDLMGKCAKIAAFGVGRDGCGAERIRSVSVDVAVR